MRVMVIVPMTMEMVVVMIVIVIMRHGNFTFGISQHQGFHNAAQRILG